MKRIAEELVDQRNELIEKNREVQEIAKFPDQNPQPILRISFENTLLYANQSAREKLNVEDVITKLDDLGFLSGYLRGEDDLAEHQIQLGSSVYQVTIISFKSDYYHNIYFRDITEKELFEKELLLTNSRFETLFKSLQSALIVEDASRKIIMANQEFCDLFGVPIAPTLMKGMDCSKAAEESKHLFTDEVDFVERIKVLLRDRSPVYGDKLIMKDGRILERDYIPIVEAGLYEGQIWRYQDITELLKSKESLRRVEDKYRKIIEDLEFGMIEVDLDQRITKVYPAFCRLTGYEEYELIGSTATDLLAFKEDSLFIEDQNNERKKGVSGVYETKIKTKDGGVKWVIISGSPIYNWRNEIIGSIGIHIDITQRKDLEQELLLANEAAQASVKAREMFLANMSHEIRTPLNVIIGMSEILDGSELDFEKAKLIRSIHISANNLLNLVNDVLDFSKIDSGHLELVLEPQDLNVLIDDIKVQVEPQITRKGLGLIVDIDPRIGGYYTTDGPKLNQVLANLISNAIKFTNSGTITLTANVIIDNDDSQLLSFSVQDTGIGVSEENKQKIFDSFIQADSSVSRKFGGTGLGLSIAQSIVKLMGGEIELDSENGKGSSFHFQIELKKTETAQIESSIQLDSVSQLNGLKILVAEDNPMNQLLIQTILKKEGAGYDMVENGKELLELIDVRKYDLILMDIQMPVMDGVTAAQELRKRGYTVPVIALTANAQKDEKANYLNSGFDAVITKPFRRSNMIDTINRILNSKKNNADSKFGESLYSIEDLLEISDGDQQFVNDMLQTFVSNVPKNIEALECAHDE
jgi:two-component system, sensor histidine kinase